MRKPKSIEKKSIFCSYCTWHRIILASKRLTDEIRDLRFSQWWWWLFKPSDTQCQMVNRSRRFERSQYLYPSFSPLLRLLDHNNEGTKRYFETLVTIPSNTASCPTWRRSTDTLWQWLVHYTAWDLRVLSRQEHRLGVTENKVLGTVFWPQNNMSFVIYAIQQILGRKSQGKYNRLGV